MRLEDHTAGDENCGACWIDYPKPCEDPECEGLVHAELEEEDWDGVYLTRRCEGCDS